MEINKNLPENPVFAISKLLYAKTKINDLEGLSDKDRDDLIESFDVQIKQYKKRMKLEAPKYNFSSSLDGYNELARFVNKQLTFGAIDLPVFVFETFEIYNF